jgi:hypothetical protein
MFMQSALEFKVCILFMSMQFWARHADFGYKGYDVLCIKIVLWY